MLIFAVFSFTVADTVVLSTGKEVHGKIVSYNSIYGLVVNSEFGTITIKPGK